MIAELKPYLEYKDSNLPWLGKIPKHWKLRKMKYLFTERKQKGYPNEPLLAATQTKGVVPKELYENRTVTAQKDLHLLKLVKKGDYVISLRSFQGGIELAHYQGIISPAYTVLSPNTDVNEGYYRPLFKSRLFVDQLTLFVTGIREGQNIDYERLGRSFLPYPNLQEQQNIGKYLKKIEFSFNQYICAKRHLIDLLNEQKQASISRAVTQGLDPNVRLKPSGIEWLGDVPEHWNVIKGRACYQEKNEPNVGLKEKTVLSLSYGKIVVKPEEKLHGLVPSSFESYQIVNPGDIICRPTDLQNDWNSLRFGISNHRGIITSAYICFHTTDLLDRRYGHLLLHTFDLNKVFYGLGSGLRQNLGWKDFKDLLCLVPPLPEQSSIVKFVEEATIDLDNSITATKAGIDLLEECRTRIISDVVTGKVDVQNIEIIDENTADHTTGEISEHTGS